MTEEPSLIIQVPRGSAIESQLRNEPPPAVSAANALVQTGPTDDHGYLEELAGEVVLSVPSPEELARQGDVLRRVLREAGTGASPLVVLVGAAEELEDDLAASVVAAARDSPRTVILRVNRPSER
jgi:hypothetical protein